jgi:SP family facilitated glucose transporter-like MFS transporter 3
MYLSVSSFATSLGGFEEDQMPLLTSHNGEVMVTNSLRLTVLIITMGQFLVGYNIGVMNAPESVVFPGHSIAEWAVAVAAFCFGGPFGANFAGQLAETRGRRGAILICT